MVGEKELVPIGGESVIHPLLQDLRLLLFELAVGLVVVLGVLLLEGNELGKRAIPSRASSPV